MWDRWRCSTGPGQVQTEPRSNFKPPAAVVFPERPDPGWRLQQPVADAGTGREARALAVDDQLTMTRGPEGSSELNSRKAQAKALELPLLSLIRDPKYQITLVLYQMQYSMKQL